MTTKLFLGLFAFGIPFMTSAADKLVVEGDFDVQGDFLPANGITFADGSSMVNAPDKVVYINEGDDITTILSSTEENVWYRIGPGTFTLTANINARDGCRYSGAGKDVTIIDGDALVIPCTPEAYPCSGGPLKTTVESLTATGDEWFGGPGRGDIVIRDCNFTGESVGSDRKTYYIYDSEFYGNRAFSYMAWAGDFTVYAYNSTFNSSDSFDIDYTSIQLNAYNCKFSGERVGGEFNEYLSPIYVNAFNCEFDVSSSFGGAMAGVIFTAHNSTITGTDNFNAAVEGDVSPVPIFYNCEINGELTTKTQGNAIIDAASVGIGTDTPTPSMKLDVIGNTNISGDLTVSGTINSSGQSVLVSTTPDLTVPTGGLSTDSGDSGIYSTAEDTVSIATGGEERVYLDAVGNVGIGTNNLQEAFQVGTGVAIHDGGWKALTFNTYYDENATPNPTWNNFTDGYSGRITFDMENGAFRFITVPAALAGEPNAGNWTKPAIYIANNGNVGIGMTDVGLTETGPDEKLEVNGNTKVNGDLIVSGQVTITHVPPQGNLSMGNFTQ